MRLFRQAQDFARAADRHAIDRNSAWAMQARDEAHGAAEAFNGLLRDLREAGAPLPLPELMRQTPLPFEEAA